MDRTIFAAAGFFLLTLAAAGETPPPAVAGAAPGAQLPPGEGRDVVMRVCSKCHDPSIAATESLDAEGWKELVDRMAANGAPGSETDLATITTYLSKVFPAK